MSAFVNAMRQLFGDRNTGETWRVGDLAECIGDSFYPGCSCDPRIGDILRVSDVTPKWGILFLGFAGKPPQRWQATAFRKIVVSHEPASAEFTASIKAPSRQLVEAHRG